MVQTGCLSLAPLRGSGPVARLADGVRRLRKRGARFDAGAVDKACAEASKRGFLN